MSRPPSSSPETTEEPRSRSWLVFAGLGLIGIYVVAFIVQNSGKVSLDFIFFSAHVGLIWLLLLGFGLGLAGGALLSQLYRRRRGHSPG
ncbi:MAG: hypothetical protein ACXWYS_00185 [Gaiellaceae bacterium]